MSTCSRILFLLLLASAMTASSSLPAPAEEQPKQSPLQELERKEQEREERIRIANSPVMKEKYSCFFERDLYQPHPRWHYRFMWEQGIHEPRPISYNKIGENGGFSKLESWLKICFSPWNYRTKRGKYPKTPAEWDEARDNWAEFKKYAADWKNLGWLDP